MDVGPVAMNVVAQGRRHAAIAAASNADVGQVEYVLTKGDGAVQQLNCMLPLLAALGCKASRGSDVSR